MKKLERRFQSRYQPSIDFRLRILAGGVTGIILGLALARSVEQIRKMVGREVLDCLLTITAKLPVVIRKPSTVRPVNSLRRTGNRASTVHR